MAVVDMAQVPEAFVEVTVYSNEGPCSFVGRRQRALYRNVMQENYGTMASFGGFPIHSSELLSRLDRGEEAWVPDLQSSDESADEGPVKPTLKRLPKGRTWWDRYQSPVSYPSSDSTNSGSEQESEGEQEKSQRAGHRLTILHRNLLDNSRGNGSYSLKPREICKIGPQLKKPPRSQLGKVKSNLTEFGDVNESTAKEKAAGEEHEYPCPHCVQAFKSKLSLSNHKRIHSREGAYKCSSCGERFTALKALASHQRSHAGERGYKHPSDGMKHQRVDPRKGPYQCPDCKKCFKVKDHLLLHQKSHTAERPHKCPECGKSFIRKEHLSRHQKSHLKLPSNEHPKNEKDARVESSPKVLDEKKPSRTPVSEQTISLDTMSIGHQGIDISLYKCQFCGKCMRSKCLLIDHERIHREQRRYKCSQCKKSFCYNYLLLAHTSQSTCKPPKKMKRSSAKRSPSNSRTFRKAKHSSKVQTGQKIVTHNSRLTQRRRSRMAEKLYECQYCGKFLSTSGILADHEKLHTGQRPYKCHECEESFIRKHHLIRHQETHTRQKPIKCSKHVRRLMRRHLTAPETIHTGLKPYGGLSRACTITRKSYLDKQEELNAEDKLFKCQYCGKRTTTKSAFVNHGKIHRRGKKPYKCLKCGKAFFWKNELTSHEKSHLRKKLPKCSDSDKKITPQNRSSSLQHGHKRKLPCLCLKCGKSFDSNYSFTRHQRIHTPQKRFKCAVCGKGFVQTWHLKRHEGIHVKEKSHKQPIVVEVNHQRTRWKKKPFKCTVCGKRCSHMWHFDKHKKTHLKEECEKESIVAELNHVFSSFTNGISSEEKDQEDPVVNVKTQTATANNIFVEVESPGEQSERGIPEGSQQGEMHIKVKRELVRKSKGNAVPKPRGVEGSVDQGVKLERKLRKKDSIFPHHGQDKQCIDEKIQPRKCSRKSRLQSHEKENTCVVWKLRSQAKSRRKSKREMQLAGKQAKSCFCQQEGPERTPKKKSQNSKACRKVKASVGPQRDPRATVSSRVFKSAPKSCKPGRPCLDLPSQRRFSRASKMEATEGAAQGTSGCVEQQRDSQKALARELKGTSAFQICKTEECGALDVREKTKPLTSPSTPESNTQQGCRRIQVANELQNAALQNLGTAAIGQQPEAQLTPSGTAGKPILQSCREESGCVEPHTTHSPKKKVVASQHRSVKTQAKYGCKQCKKSFINKRNLLVHKKSHVGNRSFPCTQCEKSFCAVQSLNVHMRIHMGKKSFKCSECEFSCNVSSNLTRHKRTHSQGRPHPCLQCGKSFWFSHSLAAHLGTHSKNETYLCSDCGRTFKHKNLLKLHRRYKHDSEAAELAHSNEEPSSGEVSMCKDP